MRATPCTYYAVVQWDLWIGEGDRAIMRREARWQDLGGTWSDASVIGGTLPDRQGFAGCADWDCIVERIDWCTMSVGAGPASGEPWCASQSRSSTPRH